MARLLTKISLALVSTAVCLGLAEMAMAKWMPQPGAPEPDKVINWAEKVHQASRVPGLLYELQRGVERQYRPPRQNGMKIRVKINSQGMHGPEVQIEKGDQRRIAILGDSTTFGYGVQTNESYSLVLQRMLTNRDQPNKYQTLNFGVAGYNTQEEAIVLEHRALLFKPDLIIIGYNLNDPDGENAKEPLHNYFAEPKWWRYTHLTRYVADTLRQRRVDKLGGGNPLRYWHTPGRSNWAVVENGFARIAELAGAEDIPVLVVIFTAGDPTDDPETYALRDLHAQVASEATKNGFDVIDLSPVYSALEKAGKVTQLRHSHPTALAQSAAADAIANFLLGKGGLFYRKKKP